MKCKNPAYYIEVHKAWATKAGDVWLLIGVLGSSPGLDTCGVIKQDT